MNEGIVFKQFPVLFIRGENSHYISEPDLVIIKKLYPGSEVVTIKDAGHWLHAEKTAEVVAVIRRELLS